MRKFEKPLCLEMYQDRYFLEIFRNFCWFCSSFNPREFPFCSWPECRKSLILPHTLRWIVVARILPVSVNTRRAFPHLCLLYLHKSFFVNTCDMRYEIPRDKKNFSFPNSTRQIRPSCTLAHSRSNTYRHYVTRVEFDVAKLLGILALNLSHFFLQFFNAAEHARQVKRDAESPLMRDAEPYREICFPASKIHGEQNQINRELIELRAPSETRYCVGLLFGAVISRWEVSRELSNLGLREI